MTIDYHKSFIKMFTKLPEKMKIATAPPVKDATAQTATPEPADRT